MTVLEIPVIGRGREQHVGELAMVESASHGRDEAAFGSFMVPDLDELAEPALESRQVRSGPRQGPQPEAWRFPLAVGSDRGEESFGISRAGDQRVEGVALFARAK